MADIPQSSFQGPLAPKYGLNDNYKKPLPGVPNIPKGRNYGKFIPVGAIALALLILPLTIQQLGQQQDTRQQASEPTPTIAIPTKVTSPTPTPSVSVELAPPVTSTSSGEDEINP